MATQRFIHITAPTVAFASASTMTSTATLTIDGAPIQGTNATLTKTMALNVVAGLVNIGGTLTVAGVITSTQATGTAPFTVASTTQVANLNVSQLVGATWTAPGTIGSVTPNTGAFTTISATGAVTVTPAAISTGTRRAFVVTGAADTTITSATEQIDVYLNLARTVQWATSTPTTQRAILVTPPTTMWFAITLALLGYEIRAKKLSHIVIALMFTAAGPRPARLWED